MAVGDGRVESTHVLHTPIVVHPAHAARELPFEALVDTGYTGLVVVPRGSFTDGAEPRHRLRLQLADSSVVVAPAYLGAVRIGGTTLLDVAITELGGEAIIGMQVLNHFTLTIDHGRTLVLQR